MGYRFSTRASGCRPSRRIVPALLDALEPDGYKDAEPHRACLRGESWRSSRLLAWTPVEISNLHFLVVPALGTGERAYLSGAVCRHYGRLVPVEDVAAVLA